ncbi:hypothetical protein [Photobacterium lutimaris]|nr:hypothetical protein [Photobacterium lutimaris]
MHSVKEYRHVNELDMYSDRLFNAVEQKYWNSLAESRCLVSPSVSLDMLIDEGFLPDRFKDNSWINPSQLSVSITTSSIHNRGLPLDMRAEIRPNGFPAQKLASTRYFAGISDTNPKVIQLMKRFDVPLEGSIAMHLDSNQCEDI